MMNIESNTPCPDWQDINTRFTECLTRYSISNNRQFFFQSYSAVCEKKQKDPSHYVVWDSNSQMIGQTTELCSHMTQTNPLHPTRSYKCNISIVNIKAKSEEKRNDKLFRGLVTASALLWWITSWLQLLTDAEAFAHSAIMRKVSLAPLKEHGSMLHSAYCTLLIKQMCILFKKTKQSRTNKKKHPEEGRKRWLVLKNKLR